MRRMKPAGRRTRRRASAGTSTTAASKASRSGNAFVVDDDGRDLCRLRPVERLRGRDVGHDHADARLQLARRDRVENGLQVRPRTRDEHAEAERRRRRAHERRSPRGKDDARLEVGVGRQGDDLAEVDRRLADGGDRLVCVRRGTTNTKPTPRLKTRRSSASSTRSAMSSRMAGEPMPYPAIERPGPRAGPAEISRQTAARDVAHGANVDARLLHRPYVARVEARGRKSASATVLPPSFSGGPPA